MRAPRATAHNEKRNQVMPYVFPRFVSVLAVSIGGEGW